jgi:hypothetical protein
MQLAGEQRQNEHRQPNPVTQPTDLFWRSVAPKQCEKLRFEPDEPGLSQNRDAVRSNASGIGKKAAAPQLERRLS